MTSILKSVFIGTFLMIGSAAIAADMKNDPVVGTWKFNAAKSTFTAGPAWKDQTRTYSQSAQSITLNMKTLVADGTEQNSVTTYKLDGADYSVTGIPNYDTLSGKQVNANTAEFTLKKAGKVVGTTRRAVSNGGKTLTSTTRMTDEKGAKSDSVTVFDKQ